MPFRARCAVKDRLSSLLRSLSVIFVWRWAGASLEKRHACLEKAVAPGTHTRPPGSVVPRVVIIKACAVLTWIGASLTCGYQPPWPDGGWLEPAGTMQPLESWSLSGARFLRSPRSPAFSQTQVSRRCSPRLRHRRGLRARSSSWLFDLTPKVAVRLVPKEFVQDPVQDPV